MKNIYMNKLLKQYHDSIGMIHEKHLGEFDQSFIEWIISNNELVKEYGEFLIDILGQTDPSIVIETNKGQFDSLHSFGFQIASPFAESLGKTNKHILTFGEEVLISSPEGVEQIINKYLLAHNPYSPKEVLTWPTIPFHGNDIIVGVYGKTYDKDMDSKIDLLDDLQDRLVTPCERHYSTDNDSYFYTFVSKPKIKRHIKTR